MASSISSLSSAAAPAMSSVASSQERGSLRGRRIAFEPEASKAVKTAFQTPGIALKVLSFLGSKSQTAGICNASLVLGHDVSEVLKFQYQIKQPVPLSLPVEFLPEASEPVKRVLQMQDIVWEILSYLALYQGDDVKNAGMAFKSLNMREILKAHFARKKSVSIYWLLKIFTVDGVLDTEALKKFLSQCSHLEFLNGEPQCLNRDLGKIPSSIRSLPNFKGLDLRQQEGPRNLSGELRAFAQRVPFDELRLWECIWYIDMEPADFAALTNLKTLRFFECPYNLGRKNYLYAIADLPLTELDVGACSENHMPNLIRAIRNNRSLRKLRITSTIGHGFFPMHAFIPCFSQTPRITSLDFTANRMLNTNDVPELAQLAFIETLNLTHCDGANARAIIKLLQKNQGNLKTLIIEPFAKSSLKNEGRWFPHNQLTFEEIRNIQRQFPHVRLVNNEGILFAPDLLGPATAAAAPSSSSSASASGDGITGLEE